MRTGITIVDVCQNVEGESMVEKITKIVAKKFHTLGGESMFALGVNVAEVVKVVLDESGHAKLLGACEAIAKMPCISELLGEAPPEDLCGCAHCIATIAMEEIK